MATDANNQFVLPEQLITSVDLSRTIRELEGLDESLRQAEIRKPGTPTKLSRSSITLEDLARLNNVSLMDKTQRTQLINLLKNFIKHAPVVHMSLATEPSGAFTKKIAVWMRANIHPLILVDFGLQPTLAAGCMVRTNNKMFDMSLRHKFAENRHLLVEKIGEIENETTQDAIVAVAPAQAVPPKPAPAAPAPQAQTEVKQ